MNPDVILEVDRPEVAKRSAELQPSAGCPGKVGAPGGIRTPNPRIRSPMLCPVELRAHQVFFVNQPYHDRAICGEYPQTTRDPFC